MNSFLDGAKYSSPFLKGFHWSEFISSGLFRFLDSKLEEPQALISMPKFFVYHSFASCKLSDEKKTPPMPVTLGVVSLDEVALSFFCSSMFLFFIYQLKQ